MHAHEINPVKISLIQKVTVCLLAGLLVVETISVTHKNWIKFVPAFLPQAIAACAFAAALVFIVVWFFLEKKRPEQSEKIFLFWRSVIIYCIALVLTWFG